MTYAELASRLGVELDSAKRRVARAGWRRQAGNDGRVRVAVPLPLAEAEVDTSKDGKDGRQADGAGGDGVDSAASVSPLALRMVAAAEAAAEAARAALAERTRELAEARGPAPDPAREAGGRPSFLAKCSSRGVVREGLGGPGAGGHEPVRGEAERPSRPGAGFASVTGHARNRKFAVVKPVTPAMVRV
jgi:hypothetical protein